MIELQPFTREDIPRLVSWIHSQALLIQWSGGFFEHPFTKEQYEEYYGKVLEEPHRTFIWKCIHRQSNQVIGHIELCEIDRDRKTAKIARVFVIPEEQGKGYGTQMLKEVLAIGFEKLGLEKIILNVLIFNVAAIACYKKVGFGIESVTEERVRIGDKFWSSYRMAITREQWLSSRNP